jgi:hypothetical protein
MNASLPQTRPGLSPWVNTAVWLVAFLSPTACLLLLLIASKLQVHLPETLAGALLLLVPVLALLVCESVVWTSTKTLGRRLGWMLFTLMAMLLQLAVLLVILRAILVTAIGYA